MSVQHFPDGIKIGPDSTGNDRLPIYGFDEWVGDLDPGVMSAGEVKTLVMSNVPNVRAGQMVVGVRPGNLSDSGMNYDKLKILHAWQTGTNDISIMVKNIHTSQVTFSQDQWFVAHLNTSTPTP